MGCLKLAYYQNIELQKSGLKMCLTSVKSKKSACRDYIYGFNGQEKDNEVKGQGNSYDFTERIQDVRLGGRFLSIDPATSIFPWYSPYQFAGNKPIWAIDLDGLEEFFRTDYYNATGNLYKTEVQMVSNFGANERIQTVHHTNIVEVIDPNTGQSSLNVNYAGTRIGSNQGVNAFISITPNSPSFITQPVDNTTLSNMIKQQALNVDATGNPVINPIVPPRTVIAQDESGRITRTATATAQLRVPVSKNLQITENRFATPLTVGFVNVFLDAGGGVIGLQIRRGLINPNGPQIFGTTFFQFTAGNSPIPAPTRVPNLIPHKTNDVPRDPSDRRFFGVDNQAQPDRILGIRFGIFGKAKGGGKSGKPKKTPGPRPSF